MSLSISPSSLTDIADELLRAGEAMKVAAQDAMAVRLKNIVLNNFGPGLGEDRPEEWPLLGTGYANEFHDGDRTPTEILNGDMRASIQVELGNPEFSRVYTDCPYAGIQQWGGGEWATPPRPFFPITGTPDNFELTPYAKNELLESARNAIEAMSSP